MDCLAREVLAMSKSKQASFGAKYRKHHGNKATEELKARMRKLK